MGKFIDEVPEKTNIENHLLNRVLMEVRFPFVFELGSESNGRLVTALNPGLLKEIKDLFSSAMPMYKVIKGQSFNIDFKDSSSPTFKAGPESPIHVFSSLDGDISCELTAFSLVYSVNRRDSYKGFTEFLKSFNEIWIEINKLINVRVIDRLKIRKINKLEFEKFNLDSISQKLEKSFLPSLTSLTKNSDSLADYVSREIVSIPNENYKSIIQFGYKSGQTSSFYFLDFDIFSDENITIDKIDENILSMNEILWEIFYISLNKDFFESLKAS